MSADRATIVILSAGLFSLLGMAYALPNIGACHYRLPDLTVVQKLFCVHFHCWMFFIAQCCYCVLLAKAEVR